MPRIKKPDPPTQDVRFRGLSSETLYLIRSQVGLSYDLAADPADRGIGDFNRLAKGEQDELIAAHLNEVIKRDFIQTYGQISYELAVGDYRDKQRTRRKAYSAEPAAPENAQ